MGTSRAFLLIRDEQGEVIGRGEFTQTAHVSRVSSTLSLHFKDGSIDEETSLFTQARDLHLLSDHHVQKGPSFPKPLDMTINAKGVVEEKSVENGNVSVNTKQIEMPPDLTNGIIGAAMLNLPAHAAESKFSFVAPNTKGRVIHLQVTPDHKDTFQIANTVVKADVYRIHYELGGVTGVIAPILGKQPADAFVWVTSGVPSLVREQAALYNGGPIYSLELAGASFTRSEHETK